MTNQQSEPNWFGELLSVIHDEELIRLRRRLQNAGNSRLAEVLTDELEDREELERNSRPSWMNQTYERPNQTSRPARPPAS